jgi:HSP20 family molecular chaperone IbpA
MDERFDRMDDRFDRMDERFDRMDERLDRMDERFDRMEARFETRIREEGETTRRHFDVMVEKVEAAVKIVAEGHGHLQTIVDNHETRLQSLEKRTSR